MKEEEAKTKWCPMVRFHKGMDGDVYCSRPTGTATDDSALCIASDCMMWQWDNMDNVRKLGAANCNGDCGLKK